MGLCMNISRENHHHLKKPQLFTQKFCPGLASLLNPATYHRAAGTSNLRSSPASSSAASTAAATSPPPPPSAVSKRQRNANDSHKFHRLSLGTSASMVFGKIKSLWSAQTSTANAGLNQLAGTGCLFREFFRVPFLLLCVDYMIFIWLRFYFLFGLIVWVDSSIRLCYAFLIFFLCHKYMSISTNLTATDGTCLQ